ncbi:MAG: MarR family winged helix-turn-helix transcriptional regulator [Ornithinimicrobium sp.]|uniref:MarR family winged helix-turn-helix transcriptional regulator n=1 Tax=Ornithinimicrobium sp. TaxID=1977084 RepID=UPI0026DFEEB4|nr:MarR family winged helix-turn-helix transcriptional regulator [Ornithinimicrobium sp.]MDO5740645.1 MarR family winged helix-turn-helix transcriptional regulator [Ornithinimicrobium sp.]
MSEQSVHWLTEAEQQVWRRWLRVQTELPSALGRALSKDSQLSLQDYETIVRLAETDGERLRISVLAEQMHWERSRLSHHLRRMESRGLIVKEECITDGRGSYVRLTAAGRSAQAEAAPGHVRAVREYFLDGIDEADLAALGRVLSVVLERTAEGPRSEEL